MPTAAKLVAALFWGALAYYASTLLVPLFPEDQNFGFFFEVNVIIGFFAGWIVAGSRAGLGYVTSFSYGLTASAVMVFWGLFAYSSNEMLSRALRKMYDGPVEAVVSIFELGIEFGKFIATPEVIVALIVGSFIGGPLTEFVGRRYT